MNRSDGVANVFAWESVRAKHLSLRGFPVSRGGRKPPRDVYRPGVRFLLVDAANHRPELRNSCIPAAAQGRRALCKLALGAARPVGGTSADRGSRTGTRESCRRSAQERGKEARGADNPAARASRPGAGKPVLWPVLFLTTTWSFLVLKRPRKPIRNAETAQTLARLRSPARAAGAMNSRGLIRSVRRRR